MEKNKYLNEAKKWLDKSEKDLKHAESSLKLKDYEWSQIASQQSAEKALKSICIQKGIGLIKIHDLAVLAKKLEAPIKIIEKAALLNSFYSASRYPDAQELFDEKLNESAANDAIDSAMEILEWCKSQMKI